MTRRRTKPYAAQVIVMIDAAKAEKDCFSGYISTLVTTPCNFAAGNLLNCTKLGVSFLIRAKNFQTGLVVAISSIP